MRPSSTIIHKGGKEEKYEIYIEDYVMSFLKGETGKLELSEFCFYGLREKAKKRYVIYGAGRDQKLPVFDKYTLLEEIGCRLTQAGPVFYVKEEDGIYELNGYEVFYQENKEMQMYLLERQNDAESSAEERESHGTGQSTYAITTNSWRGAQVKTPHSIISVQLGVILVALIAIVINSTNSYDKMKQLNQSAVEVFFAIENQEAEDRAEAYEPDSSAKVYEPDAGAAVSDSGQEEDVLKLVTLENDDQPEERQNEEVPQEKEGAEETEEKETAAGGTGEESISGETTQQNEVRDEDAQEQEGVEALSRNVARYYEIERGDTLYTISQKIYGDTIHVQRICELNQIADPDHIRYGQKIILP